MTRPPLLARVWLALSTAALAGTGVVVLTGADAPILAAGIAITLIGVGAGLATWGHRLASESPVREPRRVGGPSLSHRRLLMGVGALAALAVAALISIPAFLRTGAAADRLAETGWRRGTRLVDDEGQLVLASDVTPGSVLTVYPQDRLGDARAQALLVGADPERIRLPAEREGWAPQGMVAYSKLCTHMACPIGLYQEQTGRAVCPCHQAVFDLLGGGGVVVGPAGRPLPQLPIAVDADGSLVALGDFSDVVGADFWRSR